MKFPQQHCIQTKHLTKPMYDLLLTKLLSEGYHWLSQVDKSHHVHKAWLYIGVNQYGTILSYDNTEHYIAIDSEKWDNVLSEEWLMRYLK